MSILAIDVGKKNLGFCVYSNECFEFGLWNMSKEIKKQSIENRNEVIVKWLNQMIEQFKPTMIVVEQQIMNNIVAMTIQSCINTYCVINNIPYLSFRARNKFVFTGETNFDSKKKEHKKMAIQYSKNIIKELDKTKLEEFLKYPKQDDIGDAICMALISSNYNKETLKHIMIQK